MSKKDWIFIKYFMIDYYLCILLFVLLFFKILPKNFNLLVKKYLILIC